MTWTNMWKNHIGTTIITWKNIRDNNYRKNRCKVPKYMGQYRKLNEHPL